MKIWRILKNTRRLHCSCELLGDEINKFHFPIDLIDYWDSISE